MRYVLLGVITVVGVSCGGKTHLGGDGGGGSGNVGGTIVSGGSGGVGGNTSGGFGGTGAGGGTGGGVAVGGSGGVGGTGGTGGFAASPGSDLGSRCSSPNDCSALDCWMPGPMQSGPAGGMCTVNCAGDPSVCQQIQPGSRCENLGGARFCVPGCDLGPPELGPLDPNKCKGRPDLACTDDFNGPTVCLPSCNLDSDCPPLTACNGKTKLCEVPAPPGLPVGSPCQSDQQCRGICVDLGTGTGMCTESCTLGLIPNCGWPGMGPADAFCLFADSANGTGDQGFCGKLCDCDAQCGHPELSCIDVGDPGFTQQFGHPGICAPASPGDPTIPCPVDAGP